MEQPTTQPGEELDRTGDELEERLDELESVGLERIGSCFAESYSFLGAATSTPLPSAVEGTRSYGPRVHITPEAVPVTLTVDVVVLGRGRATAQLEVSGFGQPFPDDQRQALLNLLAERMGAEMGDEVA